MPGLLLEEFARQNVLHCIRIDMRVDLAVDDDIGPVRAPVAAQTAADIDRGVVLEIVFLQKGFRNFYIFRISAGKA